MTERIALDDLTSDQLDQLYAELERLTAELADYDQRAEQQQARAELAEDECERLRARLGSALACVRLLKIYAHVLDRDSQVDSSEVARRIRSILVGLDGNHATAASCSPDAPENEPNNPRTTGNNPATSDEDDLTGAWMPDPPIGCLTVTAEPDPFGYEERERTGRNAGLTLTPAEEA